MTGTDTTGATDIALAGVLPARTIKPRTRGYRHMDLAVVYGHNTVLTEHGEVIDDVWTYVRDAQPSAFITLDPSTFLATLDDRWHDHPHWRFTLARIISDKGDLTMSRTKLLTFGFRACKTPTERQACPICAHGTGGRKPRLHQCWDPRSMSPTPVHKLIGSAQPVDLLNWARDLREWAREQNLELRSALSAYGSQLLRDERFYPEPRRRVPRATNERARPSLPGNLVRMADITPGPERYNVTSIDQRSAHHRIVQEIDLPDANTLFARGYFNDPENAPLWAPRGTALFNRTIKQPGLLYALITSSRRTRPDEFRLQLQDFVGQRREWIWTNSVDYLESTETRIDGIYAAWTSSSPDSGLSRYGNFAQKQIESASPARKLWLKPLLHSTYGLLAARPRPLQTGHSDLNHAGKSSTFLLGARPFIVTERTISNWAPAFANVIHRGMIECETQIRSLRMAQELTDNGARVLHIHTDGLHVEGQLPLLPDSWGINGLTSVMYIDAVSWVANERECLPGRDQRERAEVIKHYGQLHRTISARTHTQQGRSHRDIQRAPHATHVPQD